MIHFLSEQDLAPEMLPSVVEELRKRVLMAEATLGQKDKENMALREQVVQYEARWSVYEAKMKSMEEMWQKQIASLQVSLFVVLFAQICCSTRRNRPMNSFFQLILKDWVT